MVYHIAQLNQAGGLNEKRPSPTASVKSRQDSVQLDRADRAAPFKFKPANVSGPLEVGSPKSAKSETSPARIGRDREAIPQENKGLSQGEDRRAVDGLQ